MCQKAQQPQVNICRGVTKQVLLRRLLYSRLRANATHGCSRLVHKHALLCESKQVDSGTRIIRYQVFRILPTFKSDHPKSFPSNSAPAAALRRIEKTCQAYSFSRILSANPNVNYAHGMREMSPTQERYREDPDATAPTIWNLGLTAWTKPSANGRTRTGSGQNKARPTHKSRKAFKDMLLYSKVGARRAVTENT